jgi:hypothetical protein
MEHPRLDEHLVEEGTREEVLRGERLFAAPAREPHADRHCELDYVIRGHVKDGYIAAADMLTRTGPGSEFATDTAVRKRGIDPATRTRYLEELAFEVVSTQSMREMVLRAEDLTTRGVRRLLAIFVGRGEVFEWSANEHRFVRLPLDSMLDDVTLARPILIRALLDAALADDAVVDALDAKGNPRLRELKASERAQGLREGCIGTVVSLCRVLGIELDVARRTYVESLDTAALERLVAKLESDRRWPLQ